MGVAGFLTCFLPCSGLWPEPHSEPRALHLCRLCVLLLVCAAQAWLMWRFIHSQLRHWREYWNEQSAKRRVPAAPRLPARLIKRESGECQGLRAGSGEFCLGQEGARAQLLGLYPDPSCSSPSVLLPLGLGLLNSCQDLTGTWLGVGQGRAVGGAGPDQARSPSGNHGAGQWLGGELWQEACPQDGFWTPARFCACSRAARPLCPHLPSALCHSLPPPPRLLALCLSPGMTQGGTVLGGRQGWDTHFSFDLSHISLTTHPSRS